MTLGLACALQTLVLSLQGMPSAVSPQSLHMQGSCLLCSYQAHTHQHHDCMCPCVQLAERLYTSGYLSYPRYTPSLGCKAADALYSASFSAQCPCAHLTESRPWQPWSLHRHRGLHLQRLLCQMLRGFSGALDCRTESSAYPQGFDFQEVLVEQRRHPIWGQYAGALLSEGFTTPKVTSCCLDAHNICGSERSSEPTMAG